MKKKILISCIFILMLLISFTSISNAAMQIVPDASPTTNITISDAFAYCYNLRATGSTLGYNTLDPHLTTGNDWGAVAYLAASAYGCNMDSTSVANCTTSGNNSGVMDFGKTYTYVSVIGTYTSSYMINLSKYRDTKYVNYAADNLTNGDYGIGKAHQETSMWDEYANVATFTTNYPLVYRCRMFSMLNKYNSDGRQNGNASSELTFRPAIWN